MSQKTSQKKKTSLREFLGNTLIKRIKDAKIKKGPAIATMITFLVSAIVVINSANSSNSMGDLSDFEVGKVAERDVVAEKPLSYVDEEATRLKIAEQEHLVPAVFRYEPEVELEARKSYARFTTLCENFFEKQQAQGPENFRLTVYAEFPSLFPGATLDTLFQNADRASILENGAKVIEHLMEKGIFGLPRNLSTQYNPVMVEVLRRSGPQMGREQVGYENITALYSVRGETDAFLANSADFSPAFKSMVFDITRPFLKENVVFSKDETDQRVAEAAAHVEPVSIQIEQGQRIIKKGFVVDAGDIYALTALSAALTQRDPRGTAGLIMILFMLYAAFIFLGIVRTLGRALTDGEIYLLTALTGLYIMGSALIKNVPFHGDFFPISIVLPTALVIMLPSLLISPSLALSWALLLPLAGFLTRSFDMPSYIFALVSGIVASYSLKNAERRMDLVKAGITIAIANCFAIIAVLLVRHAPVQEYPAILFWAAFNGIASGMLVLGLLPPLEQGLNAVTTFRLIELSDLNAPIIKKLFTTAPGTYSHSIMVSHLAEAACQEIGANSLLARVGGYYHDIGKMEQPDYFTENQSSGYNKHDEIPPRLSATIIRSHVKIGAEKARSMRLPQPVIDIILQHHGNDVIRWFYNKALEQEKDVSVEDFSYPGAPPRSRESAVVMLADVSEAAVRSLEKPTAAKIEKFIQELIDSKVAHGQLAESELTFHDLETIRKAFSKVLASYYHSRIAYPKEKREAPQPGPAAEAAPQAIQQQGPPR
jgi:putative nucleotidyltransferase with HDIG domain